MESMHDNQREMNNEQTAQADGGIREESSRRPSGEEHQHRHGHCHGRQGNSAGACGHDGPGGQGRGACGGQGRGAGRGHGGHRDA